MRKTRARHIESNINEPTLTPDSTLVDMALLLNWYNYHKSSDDARQYFLNYLKIHQMDVFEKLKSRVSNINIPTTIGWLCRIYVLNETLFPEKYLKNINDETNRVLQVVSEQPTTDTQPIIKRPSVQDNIQKQLQELLGELNGEVDDFIASGCIKQFSMYDWLKANDVKHAQARNIAAYYEKNVLPEIQEALEEKCKQLAEAYAFLTKPKLKMFIKFVEDVISDCNRWGDVAKHISMTNKTPRKKRAKPAAKQIEKLQYLKDHGELKSVYPTQIVGATQLWVYNVKYKTLGVYVCDNAHGFAVQGCPILNYNPAESVCKTLRKPEEILPKVLDAGKVVLRKILGSIRTKEKKLTGRINKDTILVKVL